MRKRRSSINGLLLFLIYGMFALFSLFLVVIGAKVYREIVTTREENTAIRTAFSYVANKLRMNTGGFDGIYLEEREQISVLVLRGEKAAEGYETLIYYYDGALRECFTPTEQPFSPTAGEIIMKTGPVTIEQTEPGQLCLCITEPDGNFRRMHLNYPYSEEK